LISIDYRAVGMWATGRLSTYPQRRPVDPVGNRDVIHKYTGPLKVRVASSGAHSLEGAMDFCA
jgi:hypothetical protein